jgi:glycosyltransferase involved in cell wall biosynthesis
MRIAFFCPHSDPLAAPGEPDSGGQCVYEARVAECLAKLDHEIRLYTRLWGDKPKEVRLSDRASVFRYPMGPSGFLRKEDMGPHLPEFVSHTLAEQATWLAEVDVIHGHYWDGGAAALMTSLAFGKPFLFTSHSLGLLKRDRLPDPTPDGSQFHYDLRIEAERRILAAADAIIAFSRNEQEALTRRYGAESGKVYAIPGGVDLGNYRVLLEKVDLQRELGFTSDFVIFTTGRLDPRKGFLEFIEAIPRVIEGAKAVGKTVTILVPSGSEQASEEEESYRATLQARATALGATSAIRWFQRLTDEELRLYYAAADVFICPSAYEPFALSIVEAFASGTPVVATQYGGASDIVTPGVNGYLTDPSDPETLAARILNVLLAPDSDRWCMKEAAARTAHERYAWPAVAASIAEVYAQLASASKNVCKQRI